MSIKGSTITIIEHPNFIGLNQDLHTIKVANINDINIILDVLLKAKEKYYELHYKNITVLNKTASCGSVYEY